MINEEKTSLNKTLIMLQGLLLPIQIFVLKEFFDFNVFLYFVISFPYFIYMLFMKAKIDSTNYCIKELINKVQEIQIKLDKQN